MGLRSKASFPEELRKGTWDLPAGPHLLWKRGQNKLSMDVSPDSWREPCSGCVGGGGSAGGGCGDLGKW